MLQAVSWESHPSTGLVCGSLGWGHGCTDTGTHRWVCEFGRTVIRAGASAAAARLGLADVQTLKKSRKTRPVRFRQYDSSTLTTTVIKPPRPQYQYSTRWAPAAAGAGAVAARRARCCPAHQPGLHHGGRCADTCTHGRRFSSLLGVELLACRCRCCCFRCCCCCRRCCCHDACGTLYAQISAMETYRRSAGTQPLRPLASMSWSRQACASSVCTLPVLCAPPHAGAS